MRLAWVLLYMSRVQINRDYHLGTHSAYHTGRHVVQYAAIHEQPSVQIGRLKDIRNAVVDYVDYACDTCWSTGKVANGPQKSYSCSRRPLMDKDKLLLEEYKLCQESTQKLESTIWQTSGVIGIGSIGSFIYLAVRQTEKINTLLVFAAGCVIVLTVWIWWNISLRWWDIQHAIFLRMGDIEENLKYLFQKRYVNFRDGTRNVFWIDPKYLGYGDPARGNANLTKNPKFARRGVQGSLKWFPLLITGAWLLYFDFLVLPEPLPAPFDFLSFKCLVAIVVLAFLGVWGLCMKPHRRPDWWAWLENIRTWKRLAGSLKVVPLTVYVALGWSGRAGLSNPKPWVGILLVAIFAVMFFGGLFLLFAGFSFPRKRKSKDQHQR